MSSQKWESKIPDGKRVQPSCSSSATNGHTLWVKNMRYCSEFMVRNLWFLVPLPLVLSLWIRYEKVINWKLCFQNDKVFTRMMMFSLKPLFEPKKNAIWWLFNDDLRTKEREWEEKWTRNSVSMTFVELPLIWSVLSDICWGRFYGDFLTKQTKSVIVPAMIWP